MQLDGTLGARKMRRYPPSPLYRYLDLAYTQIYTYTQLNSHTHNTTPPFYTVVQAPYLLPSATQTHIQHSRYSHRIGEAQTQASYPLTPSPPTSHRTKHIHNSHTPPTLLIPHTTLIHSTSAALNTIPEPRVPPTRSCPALNITIPSLFPHQHCRHPHTLSQHTHMRYKQQYAHHSHRTHRTHIGYRDNLTDRQTKDDHMTTHATQAHRLSSKSERNLIFR